MKNQEVSKITTVKKRASEQIMDGVSGAPPGGPAALSAPTRRVGRNAAAARRSAIFCTSSSSAASRSTVRAAGRRATPPGACYTLHEKMQHSEKHAKIYAFDNS
jgi:hypothetical protein